ncbi:MAG: aminotransferase class I/II-fold pyridoxal phosphate-dependent enzyme, partial [Casimicrobium sp.]
RLSAERRQWILNAAQQNDALIIENEYDHEFVHEGQRFAPMAATSAAQCILVGTFARAVSPALRLGYVVAPSEVIASLANAIAADQLQAAWPVQLSANWLLRSGEMERHLRRVGKHYARIRLELKTQLQSLAPLVTIRGDEGGLHVVLDCSSLSAGKFTELNKRLRTQGVMFDRIDQFVIEGSAPRALLIGYGHLNLAEIKRSCKLLTKTFASLP